MANGEENREDQNQYRRQGDVALITLTQKIVENNNAVSTGVGLIGENIEALAEATQRVEDKIDDLQAYAEGFEEIGEELENFKEFHEKHKSLIEQIEQTGILKMIKNAKKIIIALLLALAGNVVWVLVKDVVIFYVQKKIEGTAP